MSSATRFGLALIASSAITASALSAQTNQHSQLPALKQLSIEELLDVRVSLPLRREDSVRDAPAAISVLTDEDIRRQGAVSLPEALRYVPGLYVGRFSGVSWIIASRGFASTTTNKLLAMVDGRSIYSPLFSGVFWEVQDTMLADLDRVEVIRGPGAALWGSNAVNGVINVVSKPASATQGWLVSAGGGVEEQGYGAVRYGGRAGAGHYRIYGQGYRRDAMKIGALDARDQSRHGQGGVRLDLGSSDNTVTLQGDAYVTRAGAGPIDDIHGEGANVLARWTRQVSARAELQLQTYFDRSRRFVTSQADERRNTFDVDLQHVWAAHPRHVVSSGGGYRYSSDDVTPLLVSFTPLSRGTSLLNAFVQDEFQVSGTVTAIAGVKVERNDYTGVEWQPSARLRWKVTPEHLVWGGVSRAVRLPTRFDTDLRVIIGGQLLARGRDDFASEKVIAYEAGIRSTPSPLLSFDVTAFHNRYNDLRTQELEGGVIVLGNGLNNHSTGATLVATLQPRAWVRLTASYTRLAHDLFLDPDSRDLGAGLFETVDPNHMSHVLLRLDLPRQIEIDVMTTLMGRLAAGAPNAPGTPAYQEASLRVGWRLAPRVELSLIGRDLLNPSHVEFVSPTSPRVTRVERAVHARIAVAF